MKLAEERAGWALREQGLIGEAEVLQDRILQLEAQAGALEQKLRQTVQVNAPNAWFSQAPLHCSDLRFNAGWNRFCVSNARQ